MSPEQITAKRIGLDHRTDVFSLGVVLYELLTQRRPFEGDTTAQLASQILYAEPSPVRVVRSQCPSELAVICGKALEKRPQDRYQSAAELAADLRRHLADEPILAKPPGPVTRAMKWARRNPAISSASAIGVTALAVVSALLADNVRTNAELAEQTRVAEASAIEARAAEASAEEARSKTAAALVVAEEERADVLRLSAQQNLDDLFEEEAELWPAHPERIADLRNWLVRAEALVSDLPLHLETRARLREKALPRSAEQREADRQAHPRFGELQALEGELSSKRSALAVRRGEAQVEAHPLDLSELPEDRSEWNAIAWPLVAPDRSAFGQEARGLAIASEALTTAVEEERAAILDTLAWARHALGDDEGALEASRTALEAASEELAEDREGYLVRFAELIEAAHTPEGLSAAAEEVATLEAHVIELEAEVDERVLWSFPDDSTGDEARWWNGQLTQLIKGLEALRDELVSADEVAGDFGWSVGKRLAFAEALKTGFATGGEQATSWAAVLDEIRASHDSLTGLEPQMGLVPIGQDPQSGLWEFAHLASGEPATRGEDGTLSLREETGVVLVLIPGGTFVMGAQSTDPKGRNYDPDALGDEGPVHDVTLSPYFLSKYEMTQGQWLAATGAEPSYYRDNSLVPSLLHPVEQVSWTDCMVTMSRMGMQLPTEAQWENGCRAGTQSVWWFGDERESLRGKINIADRTAAEYGVTWDAVLEWPDNEDGGVVHVAVGHKGYPANAYGLHEVHGNAWEWCLDGWASDAYGEPRREDPLVPWQGSEARVYRGGGFDLTARDARSAFRDFYTQGNRSHSIGLRPARGITAGSFTTSPERGR